MSTASISSAEHAESTAIATGDLVGADVTSLLLLEESLGATSLDESITSSPTSATAPDGTIDAWRPPPAPGRCRHEKLIYGDLESASPLNLQKSVSSSEELLNIASLEQHMAHNTTDDSQSSGTAPSGPIIWERIPPDWYYSYYIRVDRQGSFHVHPDIGGLFESLREAEDAISRHLDERRSPAMCAKQDELSPVERQIQRRLFFLDGTRRRGHSSPSRLDPYCRERHFVQAILNQYNDEHNLFADVAHELEGPVKFQQIYEDPFCYWHFNFTTKTAKTDGVLLFAEVAQMLRGPDMWVVSCCCIIRSIDNGHCYGCRNNGSPGMRHPSNTDAYNGGHLDGYLPFGCYLSDSDSDSDDEAVAAKVRSCYLDPNYLHDPSIWEGAFPTYFM